MVEACCDGGGFESGGALGFAFRHGVGDCGAGGGAEEGADEGFGAHFAAGLALERWWVRDVDCRRRCDVIDDGPRCALSLCLLSAFIACASRHFFLPAEDATAFGMTCRWGVGPHVRLGAVHDFDGIAVEVEHGGAVVACGSIAHGRLAVDPAARLERGGEECVDGGAGWCGEGNVRGARFVTATVS